MCAFSMSFLVIASYITSTASAIANPPPIINMGPHDIFSLTKGQFKSAGTLCGFSIN